MRWGRPPYRMHNMVQEMHQKDIRCVTLGLEKDKEKEQADNLKFKKGLWLENYKEIRAELDELSKVKDIKIRTTKIERNYLKELTLTNARFWFRY